MLPRLVQKSFCALTFHDLPFFDLLLALLLFGGKFDLGGNLVTTAHNCVQKSVGARFVSKIERPPNSRFNFPAVVLRPFVVHTNSEPAVEGLAELPNNLPGREIAVKLEVRSTFLAQLCLATQVLALKPCEEQVKRSSLVLVQFGVPVVVGADEVLTASLRV